MPPTTPPAIAPPFVWGLLFDPLLEEGDGDTIVTVDWDTPVEPLVAPLVAGTELLGTVD